MLDKYILSCAAIERAHRPIAEDSLQRLQQALTGRMVISRHSDIKIDPKKFQWIDEGQGRTWWWGMQQLPSLAWAAGDLKAVGQNLAVSVCNLNRSVIRSWAKSCRDHKSSVPLAWHDHATALRSLHLFRWLNALLVFNLDCESVPLLEELVVEHAAWLADPKNYSRGNNHGFEQAWILLEMSADWPKHSNIASHYKLAMDRLGWEIRESFTEEGVHKENSPGYQYFMIKRLRELRQFLRNRKLSIPDLDLDALILLADEFLAAVALDDGRLPLIGDTQDKPRQRRYVQKLLKSLGEQPEDQLFDYSESGYIVWKRKAADKTPAIHFIMKNAHDSAYHRHDDDLMIHLSLNGHVIFGDAGLYAHDKSSMIRRYVRSARAHSTVYLLDGPSPTRKPSNLRRRPMLSCIHEQRAVSGKTFAYPSAVISRRCKLIGRNGRMFKTIDTVQNHTKEILRVTSGFVLGEGVNCRLIQENGSYGAYITTADIALLLKCETSTLQSVAQYFGWNDDALEYGLISPKMGTYVPSYRISFSWEVEPLGKSRIEFSVSSQSLS